ncbi:MAG: DUF285 domain-containing protein, partial [Bacteroidales bacterium]|nr:DUF285 domain-containing protein [Bacteroidales bacterium]
EGNIAAMKRNMRNMAAPPVEKGKTIVPDTPDFYTLADLNKDEHFPSDAKKIVFGYKKDYDVDALGLQENGTLGAIEFYNNGGEEYYILSEKEICLGGSLDAMFDSYDLTELDLSNFNTDNVDDMSAMFWGCSKLTTLDLSNFNTANVNSMQLMFYGCTALTTLDLSGFDTKKVGSMWYMFAECSLLENIYVGTDFVVSDACDNGDMFLNCEKLPNFDPNVTDKTKAHTGAGGYLTLK